MDRKLLILAIVLLWVNILFMLHGEIQLNRIEDTAKEASLVADEAQRAITRASTVFQQVDEMHEIIVTQGCR